jgi:hypothetical protein
MQFKGEGDTMSVFKKLLTCTSYFVIALSFVCGFAVGAIFAETVINGSEAPTALTFYLAGQPN